MSGHWLAGLVDIDLDARRTWEHNQAHRKSEHRFYLEAATFRHQVHMPEIVVLQV